MSKVKHLEGDQDSTNKNLKEQKEELDNQALKNEGKSTSKLVYDGGPNMKKAQKSETKGQIKGDEKVESKIDVKALKGETNGSSLKRAVLFG